MDIHRNTPVRIFPSYLNILMDKQCHRQTQLILDLGIFLDVFLVNLVYESLWKTAAIHLLLHLIKMVQILCWKKNLLMPMLLFHSRFGQLI